MFGWPQLAGEVARVYGGLPADERRHAMVLASNYGEAGAVELFQPGVPVLSPHLTYWFWAPARMDPQTVVAVGYSQVELERLFGEVELAGRIPGQDDVRNYEVAQPVYVCRQPRRPLWRAWSSLRDYS
jgi:hypothetical protein